MHRTTRKPIIILTTAILAAIAVTVALGIDTDEIRMPKEGYTVQDIRFDPAKANVINEISHDPLLSDQSTTAVVSEFGIRGALATWDSYNPVILAEGDERGPIHHYRLNDAVAVSTATYTVRD